MKLLTKDQKEALPPYGSQEGTPNPKVYAKLFGITSNSGWLVTEAARVDPESGIPGPVGRDTPDEEIMLYGLGKIHRTEFGRVTLRELNALGHKIERDRHFEPKGALQALRENSHIFNDPGAENWVERLEERLEKQQSAEAGREPGPSEAEPSGPEGPAL